MWVTSYKQRNKNGDNRLLEKWFVLFEKRQNLDSYSKNGKQNYKHSKISNKRCIKARLQYLQHGYKASEVTSREPPVLLYLSGFPGWLAWFSLQIFCLNNKIHFFLASAKNSASFKRKMVGKWRFLLIHKQQTNLWMKLPAILLGLAGKIVKYRPLAEPIRLQDLEDSALSQAWKKIKRVISEILFMVIYAPLSLVLSTLHKRSQELKQSQGSQRGVWERGYEGHKLAKLAKFAGICCLFGGFLIISEAF